MSIKVETTSTTAAEGGAAEGDDANDVVDVNWGKARPASAQGGTCGASSFTNAGHGESTATRRQR
ncbi:MAG: hypothetical protein VXW43_19870, partial [Pseudomonadota bacterium]|nr:hypothetical protein [Pseudomonadota bacterium]